MTVFFTFYLLNVFSVCAQPLLTTDNVFRRGNLEIDFKEANWVLQGSSLEKANAIFDFFSKKISPLIPDDLLKKIAARPIKMEFQKNLAAGGVFEGQLNESAPLKIIIRSNMVNDSSFFHLIAHEWFHALHFVVHKDEPSWVREGLAQVFESLVFEGYIGGLNVIESLENSTTRLDHDFKGEEINQEAYGHVFSYFYYLFQKCGKQPLFWKLVRSQDGKFGEQSIDWALNQIADKPSYCVDFKISLIHAEIARFHNRKIGSYGNYSYEYQIFSDLKLPMKNILTSKDVVSAIPSLKRYQPKLFQASALKALNKFVLSEEWEVFSLGQSPPYSVRSGLGVNPMSSPPDLIFVMRIK